MLCLFCFSSMQNGLTSSCLQQREASYPYMFHDPLHSLSSSYNTRGCNPAVAHAQPTTHPSYVSNNPSAVPVSTGTGELRNYGNKWSYEKYNLYFTREEMRKVLLVKQEYYFFVPNHVLV